MVAGLLSAPALVSFSAGEGCTLTCDMLYSKYRSNFENLMLAKCCLRLHCLEKRQQNFQYETNEGMTGDGLGKANGRSNSDVLKRRGDVLSAVVLHGDVVCQLRGTLAVRQGWAAASWRRPCRVGWLLALEGVCVTST